MEQDIVSIKGDEKRKNFITCNWGQTANRKRPRWTQAPSLTMSGDAADGAAELSRRRRKNTRNTATKSKVWCNSTFRRSERCCNRPINKET